MSGNWDLLAGGLPSPSTEELGLPDAHPWAWIPANPCRNEADPPIAIKSSHFVEWIYGCRCGFIRTVRQAASAPKSYFLNLMAVVIPPQTGGIQ